MIGCYFSQLETELVPVGLLTNVSEPPCLKQRSPAWGCHSQGQLRGAETQFFQGATFVLEYPGKFNLANSMLLKVQSIVIGGVFSCPKQVDASASNTVTVIVLVFMN